MEQGSYPQRDNHFAHRFCRLLTKLVVAQEIGPEGAWLLSVIAHQEDSKRYRGPVTFYNGQLLSPCGFTSEDTLQRVRKRCMDAGWLHYESGGKRKPGRYWVVIPEWADVPDSAIDESSENTSHRTGAVENAETTADESAVASAVQSQIDEFTTATVRGKPEGKCGTSLPIPNPNTNTCSEVSPTPSEPAPTREQLPGASQEEKPEEQLDPTFLEFPVVGTKGEPWRLTESKVAEYETTYPDLDVRGELRKARQWVIDNRKKRKTADGMPRCLGSWLSKAQNDGRSIKPLQRSEMAGASRRSDQPAPRFRGDLADTSSLLGWFRANASKLGLEAVFDQEIRVVACAQKALHSNDSSGIFAELLQTKARGANGEAWSTITDAEWAAAKDLRRAAVQPRLANAQPLAALHLTPVTAERGTDAI